MKVDMLIKKVAGLEKRVKDLEGENLRWKEQVWKPLCRRKTLIYCSCRL